MSTIKQLAKVMRTNFSTMTASKAKLCEAIKELSGSSEGLEEIGAFGTDLYKEGLEELGDKAATRYKPLQSFRSSLAYATKEFDKPLTISLKGDGDDKKYVATEAKKQKTTTTVDTDKLISKLVNAYKSTATDGEISRAQAEATAAKLVAVMGFRLQAGSVQAVAQTSKGS